MRRSERTCRVPEENTLEKRLAAFQAARQQFIAKLSGEFVGKKLAKIDVVNDRDFHIEFEDGSTLSIALDDDSLDDPCIAVNNISFEDFEPTAR